MKHILLSLVASMFVSVSLTTFNPTYHVNEPTDIPPAVQAVNASGKGVIEQGANTLTVYAPVDSLDLQRVLDHADFVITVMADGE